MACEADVDALADVAAGGSAPPEVQSHVETCEACRAELRAQQQALALVDAELGDLLASEPSPSLRARISLSVADSGPARRTLAWPVAAAVAVSMAAVALMVILRDGGAPAGGALTDSDRNGRVVGRRPADDHAAPSVEPSRSVEEEVAPKAKAQARSIRPLTARARGAGEPHLEPDVFVPTEEAAVLLRFALELQKRQVAPGSLLASEGPSRPLPESQPLDIAPLDIASLDSSDASGT
jgi:hypothetical protein